MKLYIVTYDFADPDRDADFFEELTTFSDWWHFLMDTWLIATDLTAAEVFAKLRPHLDQQVNILVLEAGRDFAGYLPKKAWPWIEEKLKGSAEIKPTQPSQEKELAPVPTL
ncbi:MAG: hypothetical protein L0241_04785 [Planctomycetia bacterium]|nr:hypothetical protein [Planctomycetia bacterium]